MSTTVCGGTCCARGPRGYAGAQGAQGAQGPAGECGCPCITTITLADALSLQATNQLSDGCFYRVTGTAKYLYNDGTNSGTSIVFQAITSGKFSSTGKGEFWVPKYTPLVSGNGVWDRNGTYAVGDKTIWGGYSWTNLTGATGTSTNIYALDSTNWQKNTFSATDYVFVVHPVEYDWETDIICSRRDEVNNVTVAFAAKDLESGNIYGDGIKDFCWGNNWNGNYNGVGNVTVTGSSYINLLNSKATFVLNLTLTNNSVFEPGTLGTTLQYLELQNINCDAQSQLQVASVDATAGVTKLKLQFSTFQNNCLFQIEAGAAAFTEFKFNRLSSFYARISNFTSGYISGAVFENLSIGPFPTPIIDVSASVILKNTTYTKYILSDSGAVPSPVMWYMSGGVVTVVAANA